MGFHHRVGYSMQVKLKNFSLCLTCIIMLMKEGILACTQYTKVHFSVTQFSAHWAFCNLLLNNYLILLLSLIVCWERENFFDFYACRGDFFLLPMWPFNFLCTAWKKACKHYTIIRRGMKFMSENKINT